jgi:hypothetical protein
MMKIIDAEFGCLIDRKTGTKLIENILQGLRAGPNAEEVRALMEAMGRVLDFTEHSPPRPSEQSDE